MDPLSVAASLLAVIGAAKAGANGLRKLSRYRKAPSELADLLSELESLQGILTDIKLFTELYPDAVFGEGLYECLRSSASKIEAINNLVTSNPFKLSRLSDDKTARIVWLRHKQALLCLRDNLQVSRMDLGVRIALLKASSSCRLEESLSVSIHTQKQIAHQLSFLVGMLTSNGSILDKSTGQNAVPGSGIFDIDASWPGVDPSLKQAQTGRATRGRSPLGTPTLGENRLNQQSNSIPSPLPIAIKQRCRNFCDCLCHTHSIFRSPWILDIIIGKINVQYTGRRRRCNEFHCRRSAESSFKVDYLFPKYIMSRYMSMAMQYRTSSGPEFLLRVPRVVPWSHLLWNYAVNGDMLAIQRVFAEGKASPYDIDPRGSSALFYIGNRDPSRLLIYFLEQGIDIDHANEDDRTPGDLFLEYSFAGNLSSEGTNLFGSVIRDSDHMQLRRFSTLHKIILGLHHSDLESELKTSTAGIDVGDSKNMTPLCWATIRNDVQAVKTLLAYGANPNIVDKWGRTPLYFARTTNICKMLLEAGVNSHHCTMVRGRSALHQRFKLSGVCHLEKDTVDTVDLLVNAGIDVDIQDGDGESPLLNAIYAGYTTHTRRLLELGANPNVCNYLSRHSAIHFAVLFDRPDVIPLLLEYSADYTALCANGMNLAHMAARSAGTRTVSVLADSNLVKLDMSLRCKDGKTPADYMAERSILTESEQGLHAEFERFIRSVPVSGAGAASRILEAGDVHKSPKECDDLHLPGAYPVLPDSNMRL